MKRLNLLLVISASVIFSAVLAEAEFYKGVDFPEGVVSFADEVIEYQPSSKVRSPYNDPQQALGIPNAGSVSKCVSLGDEGILVLKFTDNSLTTSGDDSYDLWIFEGGSETELTSVEISINGIDWINVGSTESQISGIDIDAYIGSGVILDEKYGYVRLTDLLPHQSSNQYEGADIDSVGAISSAAPPDDIIPQPLFPVDTNPIGNRTPLILVHGNNGESEELYGWKKFIKWTKKDSDFNSKFKMFLFEWDSEQSNKHNGSQLGQSIDNTVELQDKEIMVLAHSRGGLVARYYMNDFTVEKGAYSGQKGGEHVRYLVTLATPHRGSPAADQVWTTFSFYNNYGLVGGTIWANFYVAYRQFFTPDFSYEFLLWDDVNNELTNDEVCWQMPLGMHCEPVLSINSHLLELNQNENYLDKIIAFGSNENIGNKPIFRKRDIKIKHRALTTFSLLMADMHVIPNGYSHGDVIMDEYRQFVANDGMVPLTSALKLKPGSHHLFEVIKRKLWIDGEKINKIGDNKDFCYIPIEYCDLKECIVLKKRADHLDFLDKKRISKIVRQKLKLLAN